MELFIHVKPNDGSDELQLDLWHPYLFTLLVNSLRPSDAYMRE